MKIARVRDTALALTAVAVLAACATAPAQNALLDEARAGYERAVNNAYAARGGTVELQSARTALQRAQAALEAGDDTVVVEHYAYLAKRRIETALEAGKVVAGEEAVAAAALERQRIMMEVRTREAEEMQKRALASAADADAARKRAMEQQEQAATARKQAEEQLARAQAATAAARAADEQAKRLAAQLEEMKAKKTERGMVLTLGDVLFDTGRSDLKPGALRTLEQLTAFLTENPERSAIIEGHTDSVGAEAFNQRLSEQRAQAVQNALIERGIAPARLSAMGFGPSKPVVGNDTAAGRQQNRRVEIVLPDVK
ncbi:MAG: OmpA family protein [Betaproteobacteria bacterium]|nr:OmpA family protein [Betaproteobacteria bacterium]